MQLTSSSSSCCRSSLQKGAACSHRLAPGRPAARRNPAARGSMPPARAAAAAGAGAGAPAPAAGPPRAAPLGAKLGAAYDSAANMPDWASKGRRAGVILHPTSLPGPYGVGELGAEAFAFLDCLADAGMQCWQVLPLVPPDPEYFSPYSGLEANCGNPLLISLDALVTEGLLDKADAPAGLKADGDVDFAAVAAAKLPLLSKAARALLSEPCFAGLRESMTRFRAANPWIEDSALFDALRVRPDLEGKE